MVLILWTLFFIFQCATCAPLETNKKFNVSRKVNSGDEFTNLHPRCNPEQCTLYDNATALGYDTCTCKCPPNSPIFLQHVERCSLTVDECYNMILFHSTVVAHRIAPTIFLPLKGNIVNPKIPIDWAGAGVPVDANGTVNCEIGEIGYLTEHGWDTFARINLFDLTNVNRNTFLKWNGDMVRRKFYQGKLIQVTLKCNHEQGFNHCLIFRVIGNDEAAIRPLPVPVKERTKEPNNDSNYGIIVAIISACLLILTIVGTTILWMVCWKHHKDNLSRKIQLQFLYQQRLHQQAFGFPPPSMQEAMVSGIEIQPSINEQQMRQAEAMRQHHWDANLCNSPMGSEPDRGRPLTSEDQVDQLPPPPPYPQVKRKLFFSPEFFDPELMNDPPPMAEEFLYEVRRMIDFAKNRIRARRHIPSLVIIPESEENNENGNCEQIEMDVIEEDTVFEQERQEADSPHSSGNSRDSGTNSMSDSIDESGSTKPPNSKDSGVEENIQNNPDSEQKEKVSHWLNDVHPESMETDEKPTKHSRLFRYFAARQAQPPPVPPAKTQDSQITGSVRSPALMRRYGLAPKTFDQQGPSGPEFWLNRAKNQPVVPGQTKAVVFPSESTLVKSLPRLHATKLSTGRPQVPAFSSQTNGF